MKWEFKDGNWIHSTAIIHGNVIMGKGNIIYPYVVIGELGFIRGLHPIKYPGAQITIGDRNQIGAHVSIMAGEEGSRIGSDNLIMNYVNIGHDCVIGHNNEIGAGTVVCGYVTIGNNNKIKVSCALRNRITIGDDNVLGMMSNVVCSIGSNIVVMGNPAKEHEHPNNQASLD